MGAVRVVTHDWQGTHCSVEQELVVTLQKIELKSLSNMLDAK